jgi:hypothetical protein
VRDIRQGVKLGLQPLNQHRVPGQMEENVSQCCSNAVTARDDDQLGVSVEVQLVTLRLGAFVVCGQDAGEDVWLLRLFLESC